MSRENVNLARRAYEAFNRRDIDGFLELMDADVEFVPRTGGLGLAGSFHGHGGIRRWWDDLLAVFPDLTLEVVEVRDLGDLTLAEVRNRGRGAASDAPLEEMLWMLTRWTGGKCVWRRNFSTEADVLEAAAHYKS